MTFPRTRLSSISLTNFRNYASASVQFDGSLNLILGRNGQGKTNLAEAIYYLLRRKSPRTSSAQELISLDKDFFFIKGALFAETGEYSLEAGCARSGDKTYKVNGKKAGPGRVRAAGLRASYISLEDTGIITGSPSARREFFDDILVQRSDEYAYNLSQYEKALARRNLSLKMTRQGKRGYDPGLWDSPCAKYGSRVMAAREALCAEMGPLLSEYITVFSKGASLGISYEPSIAAPADPGARGENILENIFLKYLQDNKENDIIRGLTEAGPHRDDMAFLYNGKDARKFASQGETRMVVLCLKSSEITLLGGFAGAGPVIIMDDFMLELDAPNKRRFLEFVRGRGQLFICGVDETAVGFKAFEEGKKFLIENAEITI